MTVDKPSLAEDNTGDPSRSHDGEARSVDRLARFSSAPIDVPTGELRVARGGLLRASAIGSCVAVVLFDVSTSTAGLAHVMLPGSAPPGRKTEPTKYANSGIQELVRSMAEIGARQERLIACIAGGGNVLQRKSDTLCDANVKSVIRSLQRLGIPLKAEDVRGIQRRSLTVDVDARSVLITVGDGEPTLLWDWCAEESGKEQAS